MRAPFSFLSPGRFAGLALLVPWLALAQNPPPKAHTDAADPAAPTSPMVYRGMAAEPGTAPDGAPQDWRAAHAAVSAFPRGHADIVVWEATQAAASTPSRLPQHHGERTP